MCYVELKFHVKFNQIEPKPNCYKPHRLKVNEADAAKWAAEHIDVLPAVPVWRRGGDEAFCGGDVLERRR